MGWWLWLVLAVGGVLLVPLYARRLRHSGWPAALGVGLQIGGALGNSLDRLVFGGATDVLYVGWGPIWNLADVALVLGTLLATWALSRASQLPLERLEGPRARLEDVAHLGRGDLAGASPPQRLDRRDQDIFADDHRQREPLAIFTIGTVFGKHARDGRAAQTSGTAAGHDLARDGFG
jgi:signal peptidase II